MVLMATTPQLSGQPAPLAATNALGPRMTFPTNDYNFGKVLSGELVKHVFIVSNAGDQTLEISKVEPGCHCTTVGDWSRQIAPGQTGEIPIQFDSRGFRGDVRKPIKVTANDKLALNQTITLRGTVLQAFTVNPQTAFIPVSTDALTNSTIIVHITNQLDAPVTLSSPTATGPFKAELTTVRPGKEFEVIVTTVPPLASGMNAGTVSLTTSTTNMPVIKIQTYAMVQPALSVMPLQITVPPKIGGWTTNIVTITANGKQALILSDPQASDKRIVVELKETVPGRSFRLAAAFPPDFELAPGQEAHVSVKSNNAERPLIVVPIVQWLSRRR
jgi:hypothetical protein